MSTHIYNKVFNEYLGLWEQLNNPNFKGVEFDPFLKEAGSNAFTMSPTRWVELTNAVGIVPWCEKKEMVKLEKNANHLPIITKK